MKQPGIHFRILLAAFLLISATTFTLGAMGVNVTRKFMQSRFEERISFLARYLALNAELGILIDDRVMLKTDVAQVTILDSNGKKIADISKDISGPLNIVEAPVLLKESHDESLAFELDTAPEAPGKELIGKVLITYSTRGIDNLLSAMKIHFIWLSAALAGLAGLIFYFISRSLVAPVTELAEEARLVAKGNLELRARPGGLPETRKLALAFNAMLDSLDRGREELARAREKMARQNSLAEMGKFSLMIAHEVKNPLGIIKSSLDILKKDSKLSKGTTMVRYMEDEIRRLNSLIEDFLTFAHPVRPSFRHVDVSALLKDIVMGFEIQKAGSPVEIHSHIPSEPCHARVDPDLITRAIGNILKNAFEANGDKGVVSITVSCQNDKWFVDIQDQGEGIDSKNIHKIFEPFFTTRSKGTGLGLAYASQVIRLKDRPAWLWDLRSGLTALRSAALEEYFTT
jgi:signal transduction histidine kinase